MVAFALMLTALLVSNSGIFGYFIQNTAFNKAAANACFTIPDNTFSRIEYRVECANMKEDYNLSRLLLLLFHSISS